MYLSFEVTVSNIIWYSRGRKHTFFFFNKRWFTEQFVALPLNKLNYNYIFLKDKKIYLS